MEFTVSPMLKPAYNAVILFCGLMINLLPWILNLLFKFYSSKGLTVLYWVVSVIVALLYGGKRVGHRLFCI